MNSKTCDETEKQAKYSEIAQLPESCLEKIHEFEREFNKDGYWNIALVAYQLKQ